MLTSVPHGAWKGRLQKNQLYFYALGEEGFDLCSKKIELTQRKVFINKSLQYKPSEGLNPQVLHDEAPKRVSPFALSRPYLWFPIFSFSSIGLDYLGFRALGKIILNEYTHVDILCPVGGGLWCTGQRA